MSGFNTALVPTPETNRLPRLDVVMLGLTGGLAFGLVFGLHPEHQASRLKAILIVISGRRRGIVKPIHQKCRKPHLPKLITLRSSLLILAFRDGH